MFAPPNRNGRPANCRRAPERVTKRVAVGGAAREDAAASPTSTARSTTARRMERFSQPGGRRRSVSLGLLIDHDRLPESNPRPWVRITTLEAETPEQVRQAMRFVAEQVVPASRQMPG